MRSFTGPRCALLLACGLMLACGTDQPVKTDAPLDRETKPAHTPVAVAVSIAQMKFVPETLLVQTGDTVVFTNNDLVDHDVTELPDSSWTSGPLHPGESWKWVAGSTSYYFCSIHRVMQGRVIVE